MSSCPSTLSGTAAGVKSTQEMSPSPRWSVAQSVPLGKADISLYCQPQGSATKFTTRSEFSRAPGREGCSGLGRMEQPPSWAGTWALQHCCPLLRVSGENGAKAWIKITFSELPFLAASGCITREPPLLVHCHTPLVPSAVTCATVTPRDPHGQEPSASPHSPPQPPGPPSL